MGFAVSEPTYNFNFVLSVSVFSLSNFTWMVMPVAAEYVAPLCNTATLVPALANELLEANKVEPIK